MYLLHCWRPGSACATAYMAPYVAWSYFSDNTIQLPSWAERVDFADRQTWFPVLCPPISNGKLCCGFFLSYKMQYCYEDL